MNQILSRMSKRMSKEAVDKLLLVKSQLAQEAQGLLIEIEERRTRLAQLQAEERTLLGQAGKEEAP
jgi:hypothetical protein